MLLTGAIYSARDAAHKRLCDLITAKKPLPIDLSGQILYFVGPTPARPGTIIGSAVQPRAEGWMRIRPFCLKKRGLRDDRQRRQEQHSY